MGGGGWRWVEVAGAGTLASVTSGWPQPSTGQVTGHDNNTNHHLHMSEPLHCTWARSHRSRVISGNTTPPALLCHPINIGRHVLASDVQGLVSLLQSVVQLLLFREVILARDQCYLIKRIKILLD